MRDSPRAAEGLGDTGSEHMRHRFIDTKNHISYNQQQVRHVGSIPVSFLTVMTKLP